MAAVVVLSVVCALLLVVTIAVVCRAVGICQENRDHCAYLRACLDRSVRQHVEAANRARHYKARCRELRARIREPGKGVVP